MKSTKQIVHLAILILVLATIGTSIYFFQINRQPEEQIQNQGNQLEEENGKEDIIAEKFIDEDTFSTKIPAGWVMAEDPQNFLAVVIKPVNSSSSDYYTYYAVNNTALGEMTLEGYVEALKESLTINNSTIEFKDEYPGEVSGFPAIYLDLESLSIGEKYKTLLVFVSDGEWVWALSFNTPLASWDSDKTVFTDVLQNFLIK